MLDMESKNEISEFLVGIIRSTYHKDYKLNSSPTKKPWGMQNAKLDYDYP